MFTLPTQQVLDRMAPVYADRGESITWKHFTGTTREGSTNVDKFTDFTATALVGKRKMWARDAANNMKLQGLIQNFIVRVTELPAGITQDDLTDNDKIVYGEQQYDIVALRHITGLFVHASVEGG